MHRNARSPSQKRDHCRDKRDRQQVESEDEEATRPFRVTDPPCRIPGTDTGEYRDQAIIIPN